MFLYIGIESYQLSYELKKVFQHEALYFAELDEAKRYIYKAVLNSEAMPAAIVCDATFAKADLVKFLTRISFSQAVCMIPFLLYSAKLDDTEKIILGKMKGVDDVYNKTFNPEKLIERVKFLKMFKTRKNNYIPQQEVV